METLDYTTQEPEDIRVGNVPCEESHEDTLIDTREEFPYVALQDPACMCMILAHSMCKFTESVHRSMGTFFLPARVRIMYERPVEERIELAIERMMQEPVPHDCFMDITRLRVGDIEWLVRRVSVSFLDEVMMERKDIAHQVSLEFLDVLPRTLAT